MAPRPVRASSWRCCIFTNCLGAAIGVLVSGFFLIDRVGLPGTLLTAGLLNILLAIVVWFLAKTNHGRAIRRPSLASRRRRVGASTGSLAAAFVTGLVAFLYEMAWIRMLSLVLGSSTHSFELMLAAFIFGLAMGGLWIRRRIDHLADPMRFLAHVLLVMGALAALTIAGYHYTFDVIAWAMLAFSRTEPGYVGFTLVAQSVAIALMVPVTFCAGMTLPLITRLLMARGAGERAIGAVYALNTVGAIVGVMRGDPPADADGRSEGDHPDGRRCCTCCWPSAVSGSQDVARHRSSPGPSRPLPH